MFDQATPALPGLHPSIPCIPCPFLLWQFWYSWRNQLEALGQEFHTVAVDLRGYGWSDKPKAVQDYIIENLVGDVKSLINALGYGEMGVILAGHDWGGNIAWYAAHMLGPDLIKVGSVCFENKITIVFFVDRMTDQIPPPPPSPHRPRSSVTAPTPWPFWRTGPGSSSCARGTSTCGKSPSCPRYAVVLCVRPASRLPVLSLHRTEHCLQTPLQNKQLLLSAQGWYSIGKSFRGTTMGVKRPDATMSSLDLAVMKHAFSQPGVATAGINFYRANFFRPTPEPIRVALRQKLRMPVLVIWGEGDEAMGLELLEGIEKNAEAGRLRLELLPGTSHWVQVDAPRQVNGLMLDFARAQAARGGNGGDGGDGRGMATATRVMAGSRL